jgi:hypothetical protein
MFRTFRYEIGLLIAVLVFQHSAIADNSHSNDPQRQVAQGGTTAPITPPETKPVVTETQTKKSEVVSTRLDDVRIDEIESNFISVTVTNCPPSNLRGQSLCQGNVMTLAVSSDLRPELKSYKTGDHLRIDTDGKNLLSLGIRTLEVSCARRWLVLAISFGGLFGLTALLVRGNPLKLAIGLDGRYSNSQFQIALWFWVVIATYLAVVYLRAEKTQWEFFGAVNIPQNLLLLSGMSGLTFAGARGITAQKVNAIPAGQPNPKALVAGKPANLWANLIQNDQGQFDIGDFQMLLVTLLAVGMYLALVFHFLGTIEARATVDLPNVDTTILGSFGLGQGAYLAKKAAGNLGTS